MLILAVLATTIVLTVVLSVVCLGVGGIAFILMFGDIIVAVWVIYVIIRHFGRKKK